MEANTIEKTDGSDLKPLITTTTTTTSTTTPAPSWPDEDISIKIVTTSWSRGAHRDRMPTTIRPAPDVEEPTHSIGAVEYLPNGSNEPNNHEQMKATLRPSLVGYSSAGSRIFPDHIHHSISIFILLVGGVSVSSVF